MKRQVLLRLLRYARSSRLYFLGACVAAVGSVMLTLTGPLLVGRGIDSIVGPGAVDFVGLARLLVLLALVYGASALLQWLLAHCTNVFSYRTVRSLRLDAFAKISRLPLATIDTTPHGDTVARLVADAEAISDGLLQGTASLLTGVVTIAGTLAFMLSMHPVVTLVVVLITPLSILVASFITRRSYHFFREQSATQGELSGYINEMIGHQKLVQTFGYAEEAQKSFDEINERLRHTGYRAQVYSALINPCTRFVNNNVYVAVGVVGGLIALLTGGLTIGQLSAFLTYANQYTKPFNEISGVMTQLQMAAASAQRLFAFLDKAEEAPDAPKAVCPEGSKGDVAIQSLCFGYNAEHPLIRGMTLSVKSGQHVAIVGPTGAGKTTLVNLLMRFYELQGGRILVDGQDIRDMTRDGLRGLFGMVLQDSWLFTGSVRDNIAYGKPDASLEEVIAAAKRAHAHSFIQRLPQGYDTQMEEAGSNLSQGQRQLLCIARVMLVDPPILLLDEATSSIDTRTEQQISKAFDEMTRGRTSFIVAHRLSTIRGADIILVMRDGDIIEQGKHEALLAKQGFYAQLYNSQFLSANAAGT